jgi:hypothetical protein
MPACQLRFWIGEKRKTMAIPHPYEHIFIFGAGAQPSNPMKTMAPYPLQASMMSGIMHPAGWFPAGCSSKAAAPARSACIAFDSKERNVRGLTWKYMDERSRNPFVLRHPMSLGDAIAALFRPKPKRPAAPKYLSGIRPTFKRKEAPDCRPAVRSSEESPAPETVGTANRG